MKKEADLVKRDEACLTAVLIWLPAGVKIARLGSKQVRNEISDTTVNRNWHVWKSEIWQILDDKYI